MAIKQETIIALPFPYPIFGKMCNQNRLRSVGFLCQTTFLRRGRMPKYSIVLNIAVVALVLVSGALLPSLTVCQPEKTETDSMQWVQVFSNSSPSGITWPAMAYDAARDQIVLFGGASTAVTDETWIWNGNHWIQRYPQNHPSARWTAGMAYDENRQRMVLFGGVTDIYGSGLGDTWEWDGTDWTQIITSHQPSPRGVHGQIAYDPVRQRVILFGGGTLPGHPLYSDTWEFDGEDWLLASNSGPSPRVAGAMCFDATAGETILFGGGNWNPYCNDTWAWNDTTWTQRFPSQDPPSRQSAQMIYDTVRGRGVIFGGDQGAILGDTWEWDGTIWEQMYVPGPSDRCCYGFAYDSKREMGVLFGGVDDQTWLYVPSGLYITGPTPGETGEKNTLAVHGGIPGEEVYFVYGRVPGTAEIPGCSGVEVNIENPRILGSEILDENGTASMGRYAPERIGGLSFLFQAVEPTSCEVSNLVEYTFP